MSEVRRALGTGGKQKSGKLRHSFNYIYAAGQSTNRRVVPGKGLKRYEKREACSFYLFYFAQNKRTVKFLYRSTQRHAFAVYRPML